MSSSSEYKNFIKRMAEDRIDEKNNQKFNDMIILFAVILMLFMCVIPLLPLFILSRIF